MHSIHVVVIVQGHRDLHVGHIRQWLTNTALTMPIAKALSPAN